MKEFSCGAVVPGCSARVAGEPDEDILQQVAVHARDAHGMEEVPPDVVQQVRQGITES